MPERSGGVRTAVVDCSNGHQPQPLTGQARMSDHSGNARVLQTKFRRIVTADLPLAMTDDYCAGYLAGATDGDGTMRERVDITPYREAQWYWRVAVSAQQREFIGRLIECAARFGVEL